MQRSIFLLFCCFLSVCDLLGQVRVELVIPSPREEADYIWQNIRDIDFFDQHGYSLVLPEGALIQSLLKKSRAQQLSDDDYNALLNFIEQTIYNREDYQAGKAKVEAQVSLLNKMIESLEAGKYQWTFKTFDLYTIKLTLYGPGGSYDPEAGSILLFTTKTGQFKQYDNSANTIIHEITHIGIENSIIQKYQVPHTLKERIVDRIVILYFHTLLPDYRMQNMGDSEFDKLLKKKEDIWELDQKVQDYLD